MSLGMRLGGKFKEDSPLLALVQQEGPEAFLEDLTSFAPGWRFTPTRAPGVVFLMARIHSGVEDVLFQIALNLRKQ